MTTPVGQVSGYYAGAFSRLAAFLIDWFIIVTSYGVVVTVGQRVAAAVFGFDPAAPEGGWVLWVVGLAVWAFLYSTVGLTITGRTIGKSLLGLKVVTREGRPLGAGRANARVLAMPLSFAIFGLGLLGIVLGRERRALHDVIAGTAVVYDWGDRPAELPAPLTRWLERRGVALRAEAPEPDSAGNGSGVAARGRLLGQHADEEGHEHHEDDLSQQGLDHRKRPS